VDAAGQRRVSRLRTPDGYTLTALTAVAIVEKVLAGQLTPGFQTPSLAYGPDLIIGKGRLTIVNCQLTIDNGGRRNDERNATISDGGLALSGDAEL